MKHFTKLFGAACVALFAMLFIASEPIAQSITYVDPVSGGTDFDACTSSETEGDDGFDSPCTLATALGGGDVDTVLVRVRREGDSVTLAAPTTALGGVIVFGVYVRGSGDEKKGTIQFTGDFPIGAAGQLAVHSLATVHVEDVIAETDRSGNASLSLFHVQKAENEKDPSTRLRISGDLTTVTARISALTVSQNLMIKGEGENPVLQIDSLTINNGATLTVGTDEDTIDLRVPLRKSAKDDPAGIMTVNGMIDGPGIVWIAHLVAQRQEDDFHMSSDYAPDSKGVIDHEDCVRIAGRGEIKNEIQAIAAGNICVEIGKIADLTVAGSVVEGTQDDAPDGGDFTTDIIFRNSVEIDGDVIQWNDARVVFEKTASITGNVILEDGTLPTTLFPAPFGLAYTEDGDDGAVAASIRHGVKLASAKEDDPFECTYLSGGGEVQIVDEPAVTLEIDPKDPVEEGDDVTLTIKLSKEHPDELAVSGTIKTSGTAKSSGDDQDFTITATTFTIASGDDEAELTISITDDETEEKTAETIIVEILDDDDNSLMNARKGATSSVTISIKASDVEEDDDSRNFFVDRGASNMQLFKNQDTATAGRGFYIPGVQFQDAVTIEGDLDVRSNTIAHEGSEDNRNDTRCAPRVIFAAKSAGSSNSSIMSEIKRDLILEQNNQADRILLDADKSGMIVSAHNLSVGTDIFIDNNADAIELSEPGAYKADGTCTGSDGASLTAGTYLMFPNGENHIINGDLTIEALVVQDDLEVGSGILTVGALHIGENGEIEASGDDVVVNTGLILQGGGVDGSISGDFQHLTYASSTTDVVSRDNLEVLEVHLGNRRLRLEGTRTNVNNLGLCSGTLILGEVETTKGGNTVADTTLYVTEKLVVQAGTFELDSSNPGQVGTDKDGHILQYVTSGAHTAGVEWFAPRDVVLSTGDKASNPTPRVTISGSRMISGKLHIMKGELHSEGDLTIGASSTIADSSRFLNIHAGATLDAKGNNVVTHGHVTVNGSLKSDGGDLHVLGNNKDVGTTDMDDPKMAGAVEDSTAIAIVGARGMIDVDTLQLGPEYTAKVNDAKDAHTGDASKMPEVRLEIEKGGKVMGLIHVPKGSKRTQIESKGDAGHSLETIVFDGTKNPQIKSGTNANHDGSLYLDSAKDLTVDSLSAMQGSVEFRVLGKSVINKAVATSSATIWSRTPTLEFKSDLTLSGTGGLSNQHHVGEKAIMIHGDFIQNDGTKADNAGVWLDQDVTKTVMGKFMVAAKSHRYVTHPETALKLNGDVHFARKALNAHIEFAGKENQTVKSVAMLGNVTLNNAKGITLDSTVTQSGAATLTLTRGVISGEHDWVVTNPTVEADLVASVRAIENGTILRSSRQSYLATSLQRSVQSAGADEKAGYLFPAGAEKDGNAYYRPLILRLGSDEAAIDSATVSVAPETIPNGATPQWPAENILVPASGESLTLDAYADIFWRVEVGDGTSDELLASPSIRVQAHGINNVFDADRLRIVQWDCDWTNARLAGQYSDGENTDDSFAFNGFIAGNLNLTQTGIALGSCSILGIAANGIENPIHLSSGSTVQLSQIQFIHNAIIPSPIDLSLDGTSIASGVTFQQATGYLTTTAGTHTVTFAPAGAPEGQWINHELSTKGDQAYAVIANGAGTNVKIKTLETRLSSEVDNSVEAIIVHGVAGAGAVNVRSFSPGNHAGRTLLASNLEFNGATRYISFAPTFHNIELISAASKEVINVYSLDLNGYQGETLLIAISGGAEVSVMAVDVNGTVSLPVKVTSTEDLEIPTEFSLHGNYPNPFNPSTRIQFDLPESAQVSLQIVDMLGREVMALPAQDFEAGANRSIELNATNLASGTYLYRMIANGAESQYVKTGRMTLVK